MSSIIHNYKLFSINSILYGKRESRYHPKDIMPPIQYFGGSELFTLTQGLFGFLVAPCPALLCKDLDVWFLGKLAIWGLCWQWNSLLSEESQFSSSRLARNFYFNSFYDKILKKIWPQLICWKVCLFVAPYYMTRPLR